LVVQINYLLQSLRVPLTFDQLVGPIEYVDGNKSHVTNNGSFGMATAFSNNIMMSGKHYASFEACNGSSDSLYVGVMRPGEAMRSAKNNPLSPDFFNHFTQRRGSVQYKNTFSCCMCNAYTGSCFSSHWDHNSVPSSEDWYGMGGLSAHGKIGLLLDLDQGKLFVYKNERKLGVMKR